MIIGKNGESPHINYPTDWSFTLIGEDPEKIENSVNVIVEKYNFELTASRSSRKGKYYSFKLVVEIPSEEVRLEIYKKLENDESIKLVL